MTDADSADNQTLFANTPTQSNKIEYMYFKQKGVISTLSGKPLKLINQFTYVGSNILSALSESVEYYWIRE